MNEADRLVRERRFVILLQLVVLGFILAGLFSAIFFTDGNKADGLPIVDVNTLEKSPLPAIQLGDITVRAKAAYVWDVTGKRALYVKNADEVLPIASITKLMTSLLAYELISDETEVVVTGRALQEEGGNGLVAGESLSVDELKKMALISSSNDAAYALAANVGAMLGDRDPAAQFIAGMNIKAKELGLQSLEFKSVTGLDLSETEAGAVGSAKDISLLMEYILNKYPELLEPTKRSAARVYNNNGEYHDVENTNDALYAIPDLLGSKTGYTDLAGGNLTVAFDAGLNRPIIITVLGSSRDERFLDVLKLVAAVQDNISEI